MPALRLLALLPCLLLLAGCGSSPEQQVLERTRATLEALRDQNSKAFCEQLDAASQRYLIQTVVSLQAWQPGKQAKPESCEQAAEQYVVQAAKDKSFKRDLDRGLDQLKQSDVTLGENRAKVKLAGELESMDLRLVDGRWYADLTRSNAD